MRLSVGDEVDLVLPLLLLQPVLGAAVVADAAAAEEEDDGPDQPEPWTESSFTMLPHIHAHIPPPTAESAPQGDSQLVSSSQGEASRSGTPPHSARTSRGSN